MKGLDFWAVSKETELIYEHSSFLEWWKLMEEVGGLFQRTGLL